MLDGIIVLNKPKGCTSHDIVRRVKKALNSKKVGHTGTLDPNATGVLPILIGNGTKLSKYLINHDKEYVVTLQLGKKTTTADIEGEILEEKAVDIEMLSNESIKNVLANFVGKINQVPPIYSAIKVNGKKLYEYARKNETVEIAPREIEIYNIELIQVNVNEKQVIFKVECSKGTYIRSLCEDIAEKLNTVGYMKELQRTKVGQFDISDSIKIEELEDNINNEEFFNSNFISIEKFFKNSYPKNEIYVDNRKLELLINGVMLNYNLSDGLYRIYNENTFIGIGVVKNNLIKREIIVAK